MWIDMLHNMLTNIKQCPNGKCTACNESVDVGFKALSQLSESIAIDEEVLSELRTSKKTLEDDKEKLYAIIRDQRLTIKGYENQSDETCDETEEVKSE